MNRKTDWLRLAALVPLFLLATYGHLGIRVDVENLAMKSTGTEISEVAALRKQEFGSNPTVILLAQPRVPDLLVQSDELAVASWVKQVEARPEVVRVDQAPSPSPGSRCLSLDLLATPDGRYADTVGTFVAYAKETLPPTYKLAISGFPVVEIAIAESLSEEQERIIPQLILSLALVLALIYRHPALVVGALVAPLTGLYLLEGVQGLLGYAIDPISGLLGPTVLTVGVASSVHVLERYQHELRRLDSVELASRSAARQLRVPFLLALLTTIAGFLGLLSNPIPAVRQFGLLAPVGVLMAMGTAFLILPSLLRIAHRPKRQSVVPGGRRGSIRHALIVQRWALPIVGLSSLLVLAGGWALRETHVDNDLLKILAKGNRVQVDTSTIAEAMGGSQTVELLLPPREHRAEHPSVGLFSMAALMGRIGQIDGIVSPAAKPQISEAGYGLLSFVMAPGGSESRAKLFDEVQNTACEAGFPGAQVTGLAVHIARDSNALVHGQSIGIIATAFGLWLVMAIGFRSAKVALLGLIPNLLPLILINGGLAQMGRPISVASSMIGTVMMGLVVDDTIHWLHAYHKTRGRTVLRVARAYAEVRRAILVTTLVLVVGFTATLGGELPPTREFGMLAISTLLIALLADLMLLPAMIQVRSWKRPLWPFGTH